MSNSNCYAKDYTINELKEMRDSTNSQVRMKYENMSWLGADDKYVNTLFGTNTNTNGGSQSPTEYYKSSTTNMRSWRLYTDEMQKMEKDLDKDNSPIAIAIAN